ncbi:MAG: DNA-processing protein DprA [Bacteroidales bacterium]
MEEALLYQIALTRIPGIGGITAKKLISYCGDVKEIFRENQNSLKKIPGIGDSIAGKISQYKDFKRAEREIDFIRKHHIRPLFYQDKEYPYRLKQCEDGPLLLFVKGKANLNHPRILAVIGSRKMTSYGKEMCEQVISGLAPYNPMIISGLAYGVDACAHRSALNNGLLTAAALGHGLDRIYPPLHAFLGRKITENGALLTDFLSGSKPDRENFPKRNRIIAGMCDATIVIEAAVTGGALITANIANTYNRDVFAIPGRINDPYSQGCNKLIRINKAHLLESAADIQYIMNWEPGNTEKQATQPGLFVVLTEEEKIMTSFLGDNPDAPIDRIIAGTGFNLSKSSSVLLSLEFKGIVRSLPGKVFTLKCEAALKEQ